jgi:hypothetical protein
MTEHNFGTALRHRVSPTTTGKTIHDVVVAARTQNEELIRVPKVVTFHALDGARHATDASAGLEKTVADEASCVSSGLAEVGWSRPNQGQSADIDPEVLSRAAWVLLLRAHIR